MLKLSIPEHSCYSRLQNVSVPPAEAYSSSGGETAVDPADEQGALLEGGIALTEEFCFRHADPVEGIAHTGPRLRWPVPVIVRDQLRDIVEQLACLVALLVLSEIRSPSPIALPAPFTSKATAWVATGAGLHLCI